MTCRPLGSRSRRILLAVAAATLATGCVQQGPPGVAVGQQDTNVAFGARTTPPLPNFPGQAQQPATPLPANPLVRQLFPSAPALQGPPPTLAPTTPTCPTAGINDFPKKAATEGLDSLPAQGKYRWKQQGAETVNGTTNKVPLTGFENRYIRRVSGSPGSQTFQQVELDVGSGAVLATTFHANSNSGETAAQGILNPVGLQLTKVESLDRDGKASTVFSPQPPLLYLPVPVLQGEQFSSRSVDTVSGALLAMSGTVKGRMRVDACGDVVDGWLVTATQSFQPKNGGAFTKRTYDYVVATQYGGMLIYERIRSGSSIDATFSLGQLDPARLPRSLR